MDISDLLCDLYDIKRQAKFHKFGNLPKDNEIVTNEKGEEIIYRLKEGIRFKPLEYLCEDMDTEIMEEVK